VIPLKTFYPSPTLQKSHVFVHVMVRAVLYVHSNALQEVNVNV
jgi:hypothetical protein